MVSAIADSLRRSRGAKPFQPFELVFRDGRRVEVTLPEAVGWHAGDDRLSYAAEDDTFVHVALSDLADVRPLDGRENGTAA